MNKDTDGALGVMGGAFGRVGVECAEEDTEAEREEIVRLISFSPIKVLSAMSSGSSSSLLAPAPLVLAPLSTLQ